MSSLSPSGLLPYSTTSPPPVVSCADINDTPPRYIVEMASFDVQAARRQFPALDQPQVFFDNAGGTQALGQVVQSILDYLTKTNVQLGATYSASKDSTSRYNHGLEAAARYVNAAPDEIGILTHTSCTLK